MSDWPAAAGPRKHSARATRFTRPCTMKTKICPVSNVSVRALVKEPTLWSSSSWPTWYALLQNDITYSFLWNFQGDAVFWRQHLVTAPKSHSFGFFFFFFHKPYWYWTIWNPSQVPFEYRTQSFISGKLYTMKPYSLCNFILNLRQTNWIDNETWRRDSSHPTAQQLL